MKTGETYGNIFNEGGCLQLGAIQRYLGKQLTVDELIEVERHMAACPLCREAIEGLHQVPDAARQEAIMDELRSRISSELLGIEEEHHVAASHAMMEAPAPYEKMDAAYEPLHPVKRIIPAWALVVAAACVLLIAGYFGFFFPRPAPSLLSEQSPGQEIVAEKALPVLTNTDSLQPAPLAVAERKSVPSKTKERDKTGVKEVPVDELKNLTQGEAETVTGAIAGLQLAKPLTMDTVVITLDESLDDVQAADLARTAENAEMAKKEDAIMGKSAGAPAATNERAVDYQSSSRDTVPLFRQSGYTDFNEYVSRNLSYPARAKRLGIQGTVMVRFSIDTLGKVKEVTIIRSADPLLDEEARRVIEKSPSWIPAYKNNQPVESILTCPVMFTLH